MQDLFLFKPNPSPFDPMAIERAFRACGFVNIRFDEPGGALIECKYIEQDIPTIVDLNEDGTAISISHTGDAALRAVLMIQKALGLPLRMVNTSYSFDLVFSEIATVDELEAAMENARTS